jgi:hypothetical protein
LRPGLIARPHCAATDANLPVHGDSGCTIGKINVKKTGQTSQLTQSSQEDH